MAKIFTRATVSGATLSGASLKTALTTLWDALQTIGVTDSSRTTVTATGSLTVAQCGGVNVDATSGSIVLTLPASGTSTDEAVFSFRRIDSSANTVTVQRAGADTIEGATSFTIPAKGCTDLQLPAGSTVWRIGSLTGSTAAGARSNIGLGTSDTPTFAGINLTTALSGTALGDKIQPVTASVASNALTCTLNPTTLDFRNTPISSATINTRSVGSAISVVAPTNGSLGTTTGTNERIAILAIDATSLGGAVELAIVNARGTTILDETQLITTTAISAAATSANVIYSTTARASVPFRVVGFIDITWTTTTWSTAPTQIQGAGGGSKMPRSGQLINVQKFTSSGTYTRSTGATWGVVRCQGGGGAGGGASSATTTGGAGGVAGAYAEALVTALPATASVTVGAGGTGVTGANGNAGSSTSFGALLTAAGGAGGRVSVMTSANGIPGGGLGGGQAGTGDNNPGTAAAANTGGGGGGASNLVTATTVIGGAGGSGWALIEEYA